MTFNTFRFLHFAPFYKTAAQAIHIWCLSSKSVPRAHKLSSADTHVIPAAYDSYESILRYVIVQLGNVVHLNAFHMIPYRTID